MLATGACSGGGGALSRDRASTSGIGASSGAPSPPVSGDASMLARMHEVNQTEIDASKTALTKASSPKVKSFAHEMLRENRKMDATNAALATSAGLTAQAPGNNTPAVRSSMESPHLMAVESGPIFDMLYVDAEVIDQRTVLAMLRQFRGHARDARLESAIAGDISVVQGRLDSAKTLQSILNRSPAES
jgi:predicted outer membrane protein